MKTDYYRELIALKDTLNRLEEEYRQRAYKEAMDLIRNRLIENKDPREMNKQEYYSGFDSGVLAAFSIIRDRLLWKQ